MDLSSELVSQFAKAIVPEKTAKKETIMYGTVVYNGTTYVRLDGAPDGLLTPVTTTSNVEDGDRVTVVVKDHTAIITGNLSSPSARNADVEKVNEKVTEMDTVLADTVSTDELMAQTGRIDNLVTDNLQIRETLTATEADIGKLEADNAVINGKLTATEAEIQRIDAEKIKATDVEATYAKITSLEAVSADFHTLESTYGEFQQLTTDKFTAVDGRIATLDTDKLTADQADIRYANIDFANVDVAKIDQAWFDKFYAKSGIIENVTISEGVVVKELVGVKINADDIYTGTLTADRLVVKGSDGLYYELNVNALGQDAVNKLPEEKQEELKNGLHGSNIIAKSIAAEKIDVDDLVAFNATIGGFKIEDDAIHSIAKTAVDNDNEGIYMDREGQVAFGNHDNFVKFFKDTDGKYKLDISAGSISFGSSKTDVEQAIRGGRNLLLGTKQERSLYRTSGYPSLSYDFTKELPLMSAGKHTISYDAKADIPGAKLQFFVTSDSGIIATAPSTLIEVYTVGEQIEPVTGTLVTGAKSTDGSAVYKYQTSSGEDAYYSVVDGVYYALIRSDGAQEYTRYTSVIDIPGNSCADIVSCMFRLTTGGSSEQGVRVTFKNVKLERGEVATDWTRAPEDTSSDLDTAQNAADSANAHLADVEARFQQLADGMAALVRNGEDASGSLVKVDSNGLYYFNIGNIQETLTETAGSVDELSGLVLDANGQIDVLQSTAAALQERTEYVRSYTDENGQPCLELGEGDSRFKVRITNTDIQFMEGSNVPTRINRNMLIIEKASVRDELQFGDEDQVSGVWVWKRRKNGNLGLTWKEVTEE